MSVTRRQETLACIDLTLVTAGRALQLLKVVAAAAHPTSVAASGEQCAALGLILVTVGRRCQLRLLEVVAAVAHRASVAVGPGGRCAVNLVTVGGTRQLRLLEAVVAATHPTSVAASRVQCKMQLYLPQSVAVITACRHNGCFNCIPSLDNTYASATQCQPSTFNQLGYDSISMVVSYDPLSLTYFHYLTDPLYLIPPRWPNFHWI